MDRLNRVEKLVADVVNYNGGHTYTAKLIDRFIGPDDRMVLRVQHPRTGQVDDVLLPNESVGVRESASCIWGGGNVRFVVVDGANIYAGCHPREMSTDEFDEWDEQMRLAGYRKYAPDASEEEVEGIVHSATSHNAKITALEALQRTKYTEDDSE